LIVLAVVLVIPAVSFWSRRVILLVASSMKTKYKTTGFTLEYVRMEQGR
jgi:hypothetical protein